MIVGDLPRLLDAEDPAPVDGCGPESRLRLHGWAREAPVVLRQEDPVQVAVGILQGLDPFDLELVVEAVLAGPPEPLDTAFSLGGVRQDDPDVQLPHRTAKLGLERFPSLVQPVALLGVVDDENRVPV